MSQAITNSIGMRLVLIPAGQFLMGSPDSDEMGFDHERPQHRVRITKPYFLGVYPVTQAEYDHVIGTHPSHFKGDPNRPVEQVSWVDAQEFCRRLSALPEEKAARRVYRLPTEAQWEHACRAGSATSWCFGEDEKRLGEYAWFGGNSRSQTHPVGQKQPNAWGLYDMHGNVWEWCEDWWDNGYYAKSPISDPNGPSAGSYRVLRGGSWYFGAWCCRSAYRYAIGHGPHSYSLGFRVAMTVA